MKIFGGERRAERAVSKMTIATHKRSALSLAAAFAVFVVFGVVISHTTPAGAEDKPPAPATSGEQK